MQNVVPEESVQSTDPVFFLLHRLISEFENIAEKALSTPSNTQELMTFKVMPSESQTSP